MTRGRLEQSTAWVDWSISGDGLLGKERLLRYLLFFRPFSQVRGKRPCSGREESGRAAESSSKCGGGGKSTQRQGRGISFFDRATRTTFDCRPRLAASPVPVQFLSFREADVSVGVYVETGFFFGCWLGERQLE